jgi:hypothetical protein
MPGTQSRSNERAPAKSPQRGDLLWLELAVPDEECRGLPAPDQGEVLTGVLDASIAQRLDCR